MLSVAGFAFRTPWSGRISIDSSGRLPLVVVDASHSVCLWSIVLHCVERSEAKWVGLNWFGRVFGSS